ncbi:MAG: corrinoid protein [Desulfurococcaceae archaeon]
MGKPDILDRIKNCLVELNRECTISSVTEALKIGVTATEIALSSMSTAMGEIGQLYESGDYFIAELLEASSIFKEAMSILKPKLNEETSQYRQRVKAKVVIGTVRGDIHDIGKSLVATILEASGYEVIDLGVDVPAEKFLEACMKYEPEVLALSALLTTTAKYMKIIVEELVKHGLREKVKVIVGGAAVSEVFAKEVGADGWAPNAIEAVKLINSLLNKN